MEEEESSQVEGEQNSEPVNDFISLLPDEYKNDEAINKYKDFSTLLKTHKEQEKMLGKAIAYIPGDESSPEQWDKFYSKIGRPENHEAYSIPENELPETYKRDENFIGEYKQVAHKLGLTDTQFKELFNWVEKRNLEAHKILNEEDQRFIELADKQFGDKREEIFNDAKNIISDNLSPELATGLFSLDNKQWLSVVTLVRNIKNKYIQQDTFDTMKGTVTTKEDKRKQLLDVREKMKSLDRFSKEYEEMAKQKRQLYNELGEGVVTWY